MKVDQIRENIRFNKSKLSILLSRSYLIRREILKSSIKFSEKAYGSVLDFGCGTKPYQYLFQHCDSYVGVDYENDAIEREARNVDVLYDGVNLPFANSSFDCILAFEVFEHIPNIDHIITELHRTLKSGGHFFATAPFLFPAHETPQDFQRFTEWKWRAILENAGFVDIAVKTRPSDFTSIVQLNLMYIVSRFNPWNNGIIEILLSPLIFLFNCVGIIGWHEAKLVGTFPLSIEIRSTKI